MGPDNLLRRYIRPALQRGRHCGEGDRLAQLPSFAGDEPAGDGVDVKVAQELLRHTNVRTTLDIYTRAVSQQKREANAKVVEMIFPSAPKMLQHPRRSGGGRLVLVNTCIEGLLVDLIRIEPMTSSMP
jgi:hypothetical protein